MHRIKIIFVYQIWQMSLKKFTAILFISLASMIMLAFAVIPHHHHRDYICFETSHCESGSPMEGDTSETNSPDTHHNCSKNLFQAQIIRNSSALHSFDEGSHFIETLFVLSDILNFLSLEAENKFRFFEFYREKLHATCLIYDFSGRAPPYQG